MFFFALQALDSRLFVWRRYFETPRAERPSCVDRTLPPAPEHVPVPLGERHPPGGPPQAGPVRREAVRRTLLHLQRQGHRRTALPGVLAARQRVHLRPLAARTHAAGL